jgi:sulfite exporter TauE/SafE
VNATLISSVAAAAFVGSLHCAAMCGPFVAFYASGDPSRGRRRTLSHLAYHGARCASYVGLGAMAGGFGAVLDVGGRLVGAGNVAGVLVGSMMIAWALGLLLNAQGVALPQVPGVAALQRKGVALLRGLGQRPPRARAALLGLGTALLPCGWLYAFVAAAAATGGIGEGALVMAAFWSGTLPALLGLGVGLGRLGVRLRQHVPLISAAALLALGLLGVFGRLNVAGAAARQATLVLSPSDGLPAEAPCHAHSGARP